jgi:anti-anti-sigma factor
MVSGVVIVDVSGRLCLLEVALQDRIHELWGVGHREFVLNLTDVRYIDSFGLGQLIEIWTAIRNKGGQVVYLRPTDHVRKLLQITKLDSIFHLSGEETEAVSIAGANRTTGVDSLSFLV